LKLRLPSTTQGLWLCIAGGLPATLIACAYAWREAPTTDLRLLACALLILIWLGSCALAFHATRFRLRTLSSTVEAIRQGDFTMRARISGADVLADLACEIASLSETLHAQRLSVLDSAALLETVLEELDTAVFAFDDDGRLKFLNRAAAQLLGRSVESQLGRTAAAMGLADLIQHSGVCSLNFPERTGRFEVRRRSFRQAGRPHTLVVVSDLSRALREEERRAWQRLVRVIGHEINNSLTPIKSVAETLAERSRDLSDADLFAEGLDLIRDRAASLARFVASYSQIARLPAPRRCPFNLYELLARLIQAPAYRTVTLSSPTDIQVSADAGQIEQVLINLLNNALEACADDPAQILVTVRIDRVSVQLEIADNGSGIANLENLFVPFFTTKPGGSGIGLALSRQIIDNHGGTLTLHNRSDRSGCIARAEWPLGVPPPAPRTATSEASESQHTEPM
jgi:two-component system, NtrC family, nitrogen regulation sensor histidine kinase NtrY